jgi:hypothetical protein
MVRESPFPIPETAGPVTKLIREGRYLAEVVVELSAEDGGWGPYISAADVEKLSRVTRALRVGDIAAAAKEAKVFLLTPADEGVRRDAAE